MAPGMDNTELAPGQKISYAAAVVVLVLGAGLMSGLTLGLLSLDVMDLEVLKAAGTPKQRTSAARLISLVTRPHWLLCTLLLCNAACMEALPLFLDRLLNPMAAVLLSITAILLFGEIIPQAVCSRYGVVIGACFAPTVKALMFLCAPVSWPLGKILDWILGHKESAMERKELKAMVQLHTPEAGLGGALTADEVAVIHGALDLTHKNAVTAMTPLDKVLMLSEGAVLDQQLIQEVLSSGHSRLPVYRGNNRSDICGLILVKELLQFWQAAAPPVVSQLTLRPLPRISADTPLFDVLRLFQTGNSHMALLLAPAACRVGAFEVTGCSLCSDSIHRHETLVSISDVQIEGSAQSAVALQQITGTLCSGGVSLSHACSCRGSSSSSQQADWMGTKSRCSTTISTRSSSSSSSSSRSCEGDGGGTSIRSAAEEHAASGVERSCEASTTVEKGLLRHNNLRSSSASSSDRRQVGFSELLGCVRSFSRQQQSPTNNQQGYVALDVEQLPGDGGGSTTVVAGLMTPRSCCSSMPRDSNSCAEAVPVGIITLEDVVEELLQVEILDETDTYRCIEDLQTWRIGPRCSAGASLAHFRLPLSPQRAAAPQVSMRHSALSQSVIQSKSLRRADQLQQCSTGRTSHIDETAAVPTAQVSRTGMLSRPLATLCRATTDAVRHLVAQSSTCAEDNQGLPAATPPASTGVPSRRAST